MCLKMAHRFGLFATAALAHPQRSGPRRFSSKSNSMKDFCLTLIAFLWTVFMMHHGSIGRRSGHPFRISAMPFPWVNAQTFTILESVKA